ncbi:hypothetical protein PC110_g16291 [Phytophthora cactorum]|uniref:Uncharacterized protein n=2 Tax=Phytophthora cactorum TaxID=29920 RepID=A0A329RVB4_9STRA|nr:hypothetical protein PC110_g16291 [Phytophthora cactorum]
MQGQNWGLQLEFTWDFQHHTDRKSATGGVVMVAGIAVGWICKTQNCVALSTMEAKFVTASQTTAEMLGIIELL